MNFDDAIRGALPCDVTVPLTIDHGYCQAAGAERAYPYFDFADRGRC
ncbi:MAG: hypothetical protein JO166_07240 [Deltaproteobacteria bacterium]|nr:hypothetical protein [Deltaproteobacteria bacterium]